VMLPAIMALACHLKVPLHRGNHSSTYPHYPSYVMDLLSDIKTDLDHGSFCGKNAGEQFAKEMDAISQLIIKKVRTFKVKLTSDGGDYAPDSSLGCGNLNDIEAKIYDCDHQRNHGQSFLHEITNDFVPVIAADLLEIADSHFK